MDGDNSNVNSGEGGDWQVVGRGRGGRGRGNNGPPPFVTRQLQRNDDLN